MLRTHKILTVLYLPVLVGLICASVVAQAPEMAPLLPRDSVELPEGCGFIPPRVDLSHLSAGKPADQFVASPAVLPDRFDWRTEGKVTSVKNQGACGACYAFASIANLESRVLIDSGDTYDFSENSVKECYYSDPNCAGGNYEMVAAVLSLDGSVLESCDGYVASNSTCNTSCPYIKTVLEWNIISADTVPASGVLKDYIHTIGPIYTTLYAGSDDAPAWRDEFQNYDGSYVLYYTGTHTNNHAVLIVGWDDTIPHAGGQGAWIVKNSWGASWGGTCNYGTEGGYFYIAYGSGTIGKWSSYADDWQDYNINDGLLYYDEAGWTSQWGFGNTTAWGMCKFIPSDDGYATRIEFWTNDSPTDVDVYLYDDYSGGILGNLLSSKLGTTFAQAGYHSLTLDSPPAISNGDDIYAVVKFMNDTYTYPLVSDGLSSNETGKTFYSSNGVSWTDLGSQGCDVAIRVRTSPSLSVSVDDDDTPKPSSFWLASNYPNPFNPLTTIEYSLSTSCYVDVSVYNLLGQKVKNLVDEMKSIGEHKITWDGTDCDGVEVASGVYFYRITAGDEVASKKMMLIR